MNLIIFLAQLQDEEYIDHLRGGNWDFGVIESFDFCSLAVLQKIGVKKFILTSAILPSKDMLASLGLPIGVGVLPGKR